MPSRIHHAILFFSLLLVGQAAFAIEVRVVKLPGRLPAANESLDWGNWTVSYRQPYFPNSMLYSANHDTLAAAQASAQELIRTHKGEGKFRLSEVLIEGQPIYRSSNVAIVRDYLEEMRDNRGRRESDIEATYKGKKGKQIGDYLASCEIKDDLPGSVLGDYGTSVQMAYDNAVQLKKKLLPESAKITEAVVESTNELVARMLGSSLDSSYEQQQLKAIELRFARRQSMASARQQEVERLLNAAAATDQIEERERYLREVAALDATGVLAEAMQSEAARYSTQAFAARMRQRLEAELNSLPLSRPSTPASPSSAPVGPQLDNTEWQGQVTNLFGLRFIEFGADGKVVGRFSVEASKREGKWVATGPTTIKGDFGPVFGDFSAELKDGRLIVKWGRNPITFVPRAQ